MNYPSDSYVRRPSELNWVLLMGAAGHKIPPHPMELGLGTDLEPIWGGGRRGCGRREPNSYFVPTGPVEK